MKKRDISYQLSKNYIIMFFITTILSIFIFVVIASINSIDSKDSIYNELTAENLMQDEYYNIDSNILENNGGGLQVVDSNHKIIYSVGKNQFSSDQLSTDDFTKFLVNSGSHMDMITVAYNENKNFWLVVSLPIKVKVTSIIHLNSKAPIKDYSLQVLGIIGLGYILILLVSTLIYARITAISFIKPLEQISSAVKNVRNGDYTTRVIVGKNKEFGELELSFNHMAEQIQTQTLLKEKSENNRKNLILDISHDLKNPLTSIMGYAELNMREQEKGNINYLEYPKIIYENSIRANELIMDLFELSKLESPEFQLDFVTEDFSEYIREEMIRMLPEIEAVGLVPEFIISEEEIILSFDKKRMRRVLSNLLYNVIAYHEKGSKFKVKLQKIDNIAKLSLVNYSVVNYNEAEKLLNPFIKDEESSNLSPSSSGLGLSIVKKIIFAHFGTVNLNIENNNRFEIIICLPII